MNKKISLLCLICFLVVGGFSQGSFRIKADITIKIKNQDSTFQYTKGTVSYDRNFKKVIYDISFPQKETYISEDTLVYKYQNRKLISTQGSPLKPEFSIFQFILNNDISDFGLKNSSYTATNIEKSNDLIITKWTAPAVPDFPLGDILVSSKNKRLQSVIIHNKKREIISRQIFKKYTFINGIEIPTEILSVSYFGGKKSYQIIQFDKVQINESGHDSDYDYKVQKIKL
ncbi:MAG: hypothetical protein Q8S54_02465 [Bacteroidota bacterium]|nr:hypothetical protein [Bacteroidota bacterium]